MAWAFPAASRCWRTDRPRPSDPAGRRSPGLPIAFDRPLGVGDVLHRAVSRVLGLSAVPAMNPSCRAVRQADSKSPARFWRRQ